MKKKKQKYVFRQGQMIKFRGEILRIERIGNYEVLLRTKQFYLCGYVKGSTKKQYFIHPGEVITVGAVDFDVVDVHARTMKLKPALNFPLLKQMREDYSSDFETYEVHEREGFNTEIMLELKCPFCKRSNFRFSPDWDNPPGGKCNTCNALFIQGRAFENIKGRVNK